MEFEDIGHDIKEVVKGETVAVVVSSVEDMSDDEDKLGATLDYATDVPDWSLDISTDKVPKVTFEETEERVHELVESWGIVQWGVYDKTFSQFWEERFVKNVRCSVKMKYMSKKIGAVLLGINNVGLFNRKVETVTELPDIVQDMVDTWDIVKKDEYLKMGKSLVRFWKESFVKNVLYAVHKDFLSVVGGALLLGVDVRDLKERRRGSFGVKEMVTHVFVNKVPEVLMPDYHPILMETSEINNNAGKEDVKEGTLEDVTAFPEKMGGIYQEDEFDQDEKINVSPLSVSDTICEMDVEAMVQLEATVSKDEFDQDRQTGKEIQELAVSWGIVKWKDYNRNRNSFGQFCEESFVQNVRRAVQMKYMTREGGAALLGIKNIRKFDTEEIDAAGLPFIVQDIIGKWGIVKKEEYQKNGRSATQFWKEAFVRKVLYAVQKDFVSAGGGALLLGASVAAVQGKRWRTFCKLKLPQIFVANTEEITEVLIKKSDETLPKFLDMKPDNLEELELFHKNWWEKLDPDDMGSNSNSQVDMSKVKVRNMRLWIFFLQFSQLEIRDKKSKFNPYMANKQEVAEFLQFLQLTNSWNKANLPGTCLASLAAFLPDVALMSVVELMSSHNPTLTLMDVKWRTLIDVKMSKKLLPVSPFDSTWSNFVEFCQKLGDTVDPLLAKPETVRDFMTSKFQGNEMRVEEFQTEPIFRFKVLSLLEKEPFFRPAYNFYSENLDRVLSELDWHLEHSWLTGPLKSWKGMENLITAAVSCDERLLTDDLDLKDLVLKLSPNYSYSKVRSNNSEELFWARKFTTNVLEDVRTKALPVSVAASGLGVTAEMLWYALKHESSIEDKYIDYDNPTEHEIISVKDYVYLGYGGKSRFWKEESIVELLEDVRNRNISVEKVAARFGVSRREILVRCGGVKDEAEIEAEKTLAVMEKMKHKVEQDLNVVKKKSQLEVQIEMAENNLGSLSEYEQMRLKNMKERQALVESLDFDQEKREIRSLTPTNQPRQLEAVQLREKSARVKRRSEVEQLKQKKTGREFSKNEWYLLQEQRMCPNWFGHWVPRNNKNKYYTRKAVTDIDINDVYDEEAISRSNHVPKFELRAQELLEITPSYHKSRTLLDSFAADFKQIRAEEKLITKPDWSNFELVYDSLVSTSQLTSLDSYNDYICFGTKSGGVGVFLAGRSFTVRPHNMEVTRTLFLRSKSSPGIISAALDGTVRMTDLVHQSVCMEYSWDQSDSGKQGVNWLEERGVNSFLLDCGGEINQIDIRSKEAVTLIKLNEEQREPYSITNLSVNPTNKNMISLCRGNCVKIWDLRKASKAVATLTDPSGSNVAGGGWSAIGSYLVTCVQAVTGRDVCLVYPGLDLSNPILTWEGPRKTTFSPSTGVTWCPWEESLFLTTMEQVKSNLDLKPKHGVVAVDCTSGRVVGELCDGLDNSTYLVYCSKSRKMVVVGNSKGPGGLAVFKVSEAVV